jgi:hypothetical protein
MRRRLDRALVAGVVLLVAAATVDALRPHGHTHTQTLLSGLPAERGRAVSLHASPEVAFLRECAPERVRLALTSTEIDVHYAGPPCRLADALHATLRSASGEVIYRGSAARIAANVAGRAVVRRALLPTLPRCTSHAPYSVVVVAFGHSAHGRLECALDYSEQ